MGKTLTLLGLAGLGMVAMTAPATAFWARSQWLACSEAATAADYQRWRCWELDGYAGAIMPGYGDVGTERQMPTQKRPSLRRGGSVSRLG